MSMISELVDKLKNYAVEYDLPPFGREVEGTPELLLEAADTIEALSAKLVVANMERSEVYYNGKKQRSLTINIQIGKDETNSDIMQLLSEIIDETNDKGYAVMNAIVDGMEVFDYKGFSKDFFNPKE